MTRHTAAPAPPWAAQTRARGQEQPAGHCWRSLALPRPRAAALWPSAGGAVRCGGWRAHSRRQQATRPPARLAHSLRA
eukprot:scaffold166975_cov33-Tisochrysis_lutea.AAC.1